MGSAYTETKKNIEPFLILNLKIMKEYDFNETEHIFYAFDEEEELFYELEILTEVEYDEDIMEVTDMKELDFSHYCGMMYGIADTVPAGYEVPDLKEGEKLSVTMFKVQMPNGEILSLPVLTDENAVFVSSAYHGYDYFIYEEDSKREATDDEIDCIED